MFLAFAGMETTRNQIGLAVQTLLKHPDQWRLLGEHPELGANAVEGGHAGEPTVTWVTREALEDVDLHDLHVPKGGIVQVMSTVRASDPQAMPDPSFDITQQRPPHLGFGAASTTARPLRGRAPTWRSRPCSPGGCRRRAGRPGRVAARVGNTGAVTFRSV